MERCPTCGQPIPHQDLRERLISDRDELLSILRAKADRDVYISQTGTWHYTYSGEDRHRIKPALIKMLVAEGVLKPTYKGVDGSYGLHATIDIEATQRARRLHGKKSTLVYVN